MAKNRGFLKILGRKKFFLKKIFVPSFRTFYCGSFEPSYSYVPLTTSSCSPNELAAPPPAKTTPALLESGARTKNGKDKNFWSKIFFWLESIQNGPKRISKRKSRFLTFFPVMIVLCGHSRFSKNGSHNSNHPLEPKDLTRL